MLSSFHQTSILHTAEPTAAKRVSEVGTEVLIAKYFDHPSLFLTVVKNPKFGLDFRQQSLGRRRVETD